MPIYYSFTVYFTTFRFILYNLDLSNDVIDFVKTFNTEKAVLEYFNYLDRYKKNHSKLKKIILIRNEFGAYFGS